MKISYTDKNLTHFIRSYTEASNRGEDEATAPAPTDQDAPPEWEMGNGELPF